MKKNFFAMMLSALLISAHSMPAFAEDSISGEWGDLSWTLTNHVLTVSGNGWIQTDISFSDFDFPEWHKYSEDIYEIILEEGVIGADAYGLAYYPNLEQITLPSTFTELEPYVLSYNPKLAEINGIEYIEVFNYRCLSETAYISQNPFVIKNHSLYYAEGTDFRIPDGVTEIKPFAFGNCTSTEFIDFDEIQDVPVTECHYYEVILPDSVTKIDNFAFAHCATMTNIVIPESVTEIGDYAFYNCVNLNAVTLGENVQSIGKNAFFNCKSLKNLTVQNSDMSFGENAFGTVIDWETELQKRAENDPDFDMDLYSGFLEDTPLGLDLLVSALSVEFLSTSRYESVMQNITEQEMTDIITQGIITGHIESTAQDFAQENDLLFRPCSQNYEIGDVNQDTGIDILDVILLNRAILGKEILTPEQKTCADSNSDGEIDSLDALLLLKKVVNII